MALWSGRIDCAEMRGNVRRLWNRIRLGARVVGQDRVIKVGEALCIFVWDKRWTM